MQRREAMIIGDRDTIAAIATPAGSGGIGIVRMSGPCAARVAAELLGCGVSRLPDRKMVYGVARDQCGDRIDEVLAVVMKGPRSYTGEDVAEIHGHGGAVNMARLLRAAISVGARHAEAGEFTRRAFENGRLDLTRAEAVVDVIEAGSERAWRLAQAQLGGGLGDRVGALRERATAFLAEVEACMDFPEEDIESLEGAAAAARAAALADELDRLARTFSLGRALRQGVDIAITGPVNAGKSSLFNGLVGSERAIVTAEPGTTRDFVEARAVWDGLPVTLIDTAGERSEEGDWSPAEKRGIELGRERVAAADLRVAVHDGAHWDGPGRAVWMAVAAAGGAADGVLQVIAKGDLLPAGFDAPCLVTSAETGEGIESLKRAVVAAAVGHAAEGDDGLVVTSERQRTLLERAARAFERAARAVEDRVPLEMVALELREGTEALAEVQGERVGEDVLDALFSRFCIGK